MKVLPLHAAALRQRPRRWLVTGAAGFIGSNLVETLLELGQEVTGLDNFATGARANLADVAAKLEGAPGAGRFTFIEGDIRDLEACKAACAGAEIVLHQAALGSVPRSIDDPATSNAVNIGGFLNMLIAARDAGVESFVYAASSSTYGDHPDLPKIEDRIGRPLSPYAVTKLVNEIYADVFQRCYGFSSIGLRYFNVFGRRQNPNGPYAAVIPRWIETMLGGGEVVINGDGETSRDFCYVDNAIQANVAAGLAEASAKNQIYNVAVGDRTSLNEIYALIRAALSDAGAPTGPPPRHAPFRQGDVRHSLADVGKARAHLGYDPQMPVREGIKATVAWYLARGGT